MNFLQALNACTPLQLKPDRPASSHMLSYDQIKFEKATVKLQQQKERDLIFEINKQSEILREKDNQLSQQASKMLERQLMFEIEIDRLRRILCEWDSQRRKYEEEISIKEGIYQVRLQEIKMQLEAHYNEQLEGILANNLKDIERIKELYDMRSVKINQELRKDDQKYLTIRVELERQQTRQKITEAENQKLQAHLSVKQSKLTETEKELSRLILELRKVKEESENYVESKCIQIQRYSNESESLRQENEQLQYLTTSLRQALEQLRMSKERQEQIQRQLEGTIQNLEIKCYSLEQEVEQFRSRKTQHNSFRDEPISNIISMSQSEHPLLSARANKSSPRPKRSNQSNKTKDLKNIQEEHDDFRRRIIQLEQQLQLRIEQAAALQQSFERRLYQDKQEIQSRLAQTQDKLAKKQNEVKSLMSQLQRRNEDFISKDRIWTQRLIQLQKTIEELGQQWLQKEREITGLFKTIQNTYLRQLALRQQKIQQLKKQYAELETAFMDKIKEGKK